MSRRRRFSLPSTPPRAGNTRPVPSPGLSLPLDLGGGILQPAPLTPDEIRAFYGPARTLGASEETRLAMDSQLEADGVYTLLQHTLQLGQAAAPQFLGYGALQNISQNGLIRACVETVADDMTRAWITLKGGEKPDAGGENDRLKRLDAAMRQAGLQTLFHEAAELVGYEGGAFIFIDTGASGDALRHPLHLGRFSSEIRAGFPLRFTVVDPVNVFPGEYNSLSPLQPDYFRPAWWWVLGERVHASRLIRLTANEVPVLLRPAYNFLGIAQAQILWDYVLHFQECRAAEARLLTKFSLTVFKTSMADVLFSAQGTSQLDARIRYMIRTMSNDGVLAVDKDTEEVVKLATPLSGVTDIVRQALEFLAALNRTPAVKLLGISPSGFNATGESDIRNYYDHITSQQEKVLRAGIQRALDCLQLHVFGEIDPALSFDFAPLGEEDRAALAVQQKTKADTMAVYIDRGLISAEEARAAIAADPDSGFADIDPDDLPEGNSMPGEMSGDVPPGMGGEAGEADIDDVDKAGAVYDAALDAKEGDGWVTAENGKHIHFRDKEIDKGNVGQPGYSYQSTPLESTRPDTARYEALLREQDGDAKRAAHAYFRERLQGRHVEAQTDTGPIEACFTGSSWNELKKDMRDDPVKASLVPHLPDIITTGKYAQEAPAHAHPDVSCFHTWRKTVQTADGPREVIVDVAERTGSEPRNAVYSLTREGSPSYEKRKKESVFSGPIPGRNRGNQNTPTQDSDAVVENNIGSFFEVVNLRFADEE